MAENAAARALAPTIRKGPHVGILSGLQMGDKKQVIDICVVFGIVCERVINRNCNFLMRERGSLCLCISERHWLVKAMRLHI